MSVDPKLLEILVCPEDKQELRLVPLAQEIRERLVERYRDQFKDDEPVVEEAPAEEPVIEQAAEEAPAAEKAPAAEEVSGGAAAPATPVRVPASAASAMFTSNSPRAGHRKRLLPGIQYSSGQIGPYSPRASSRRWNCSRDG